MSDRRGFSIATMERRDPNKPIRHFKILRPNLGKKSESLFFFFCSFFVHIVSSLRFTVLLFSRLFLFCSSALLLSPLPLFCSCCIFLFSLSPSSASFLTIPSLHLHLSSSHFTHYSASSLGGKFEIGGAQFRSVREVVNSAGAKLGCTSALGESRVSHWLNQSRQLRRQWKIASVSHANIPQSPSASRVSASGSSSALGSYTSGGRDSTAGKKSAAPAGGSGGAENGSYLATSEEGNLP